MATNKKVRDTRGLGLSLTAHKQYVNHLPEPGSPYLQPRFPSACLKPEDRME